MATFFIESVPEDRCMIQPVLGSSMSRRRLSTDVLDTAETLVENLDNLADILDRLAEKYDVESKATCVSEEPCGDLVRKDGPDASLFRKLKSALDSARSLIGCLRREKGRLMRRQMSVDCRLGEIEDYRKHMKQDLTSLNETVDMLSLRVCEAENQLAEEEEIREGLEADKAELGTRLEEATQLCSELSTDVKELRDDNKRLLKERTNTSLKLENKELKFKIEMLLAENVKLKELVRDNTEEDTATDGDLGTSLSEDNNNNIDKLTCAQINDAKDNSF